MFNHPYTPARGTLRRTIENFVDDFEKKNGSKARVKKRK